MDKVKEGVESTGIPTDLPSGSFCISPEGAQQALTNRLNAPSRASRLTGIPDNLEAGSFGISEAGAREALTNRIESQTGIPANLPEGAFTVTPKKKFNAPKITKVEVEDPSTTFTSISEDGPFTTTLTETRVDLGNGNTKVIKSEKTKGGITNKSSGADKKIFWKRRFESGVESFNRTKNPNIKFRLIDRINSDGRSNALYQGTTWKDYDWNALTEEQKNNPNLKLIDVPFFN